MSKGKFGPPKRFSEEVRNRARELYMQGRTLMEIVNTVEQELGERCSIAVIGRWSQDEKWKETREQARAVMLRDQKNLVFGQANELSERHAKAFRLLWEKGEDALVSEEGKKGLRIDRVRDAIEAINVGVRGERAVLAGLIGIQFIEDVFRIVVDEIQDDELLRRLAVKLKRLASTLVEPSNSAVRDL